MSFHGLPQGLTNPPRHTMSFEERQEFVHAEHGPLGPAPGTSVFVAVFLLAFMTYFFVNWKMLSVLWRLG